MEISPVNDSPGILDFDQLEMSTEIENRAGQCIDTKEDDDASVADSEDVLTRRRRRNQNGLDARERRETSSSASATDRQGMERHGAGHGIAVNRNWS